MITITTVFTIIVTMRYDYYFLLVYYYYCQYCYYDCFCNDYLCLFLCILITVISIRRDSIYLQFSVSGYNP